MPRPGDVVGGRFALEELVGTGGLGEIYRAVDRCARAPAAVKFLHRVEAESMRRFQREAEVLSELRHPGIVQYLDHGYTEEGEAYIAME
jgi:serine/threonine protein kinase